MTEDMKNVTIGVTAMARARRMMLAFQEQARKLSENRYTPPAIWRSGLKKQASLRHAQPDPRPRRTNSSVIGIDDGRPSGMSGRQWKRLRVAERMAARHARLVAAAPTPIAETFLDGRPIRTRKEAEKANKQFREGDLAARRIIQIHSLADRRALGQPGAAFHRGGGQRRLRLPLEL